MPHVLLQTRRARHRALRGKRPGTGHDLVRLLQGLSNSMAGLFLTARLGHRLPAPLYSKSPEGAVSGAFSANEVGTITRFYDVTDDALATIVRAPERIQALLELEESIGFDPELRGASATVERTTDPETGHPMHLSVELHKVGMRADQAERAIERILASVGDLLQRARMVLDVRVR